MYNFKLLHPLILTQAIGGTRWHDHDAEEIQQHANHAIAEACKALEAKGWAKESVKVIGAFGLLRSACCPSSGLPKVSQTRGRQLWPGAVRPENHCARPSSGMIPAPRTQSLTSSINSRTMASKFNPGFSKRGRREFTHSEKCRPFQRFGMIVSNHFPYPQYGASVVDLLLSNQAAMDDRPLQRSERSSHR